MKYFIYSVLFLFLLSSCSQKKVWQWRGEHRDGVFDEKNLLKSWPEEGPPLLWEYEGIGNGYGSPLITSEKIYVNGEIDSTGYLFAFDLKGCLLWKTEYGKEWMASFQGSRSTPTVVGNKIYTCSGMGDIRCFDASSGERIWGINMIDDLHGKYNRFGYSQSLMVDEERLYCSPGGADTNVVALDRMTGKLVWKSPAKGEISAYCSPNIIQRGKQKILLTFSEYQLLGIDPLDGKLLWSHEQDTLADIHANTPLYNDGNIYYTTGCGNMTVKLKLTGDGKSISQLWQNKSLDNYMGGCVKVGSSLIGSGARKKRLFRVDCETGLTIDSLNIGTGNTIYADGMIYMYNQKGKMYLVDIQAGKMEVVSKFKIRKGTKEHFSHPVIHNGVLYIRHGVALLAFDIKAKEQSL